MASEMALRVTVRDELAASLRISIEKLQLEQSFFANGGDSLSAVHFMSKCRTQGLQADIEDILKSKTLSELIESILSKQESKTIQTITNGDAPHSDATPALNHNSYTILDPRLKDGEDPARHIESIGSCSSMQNRILISQAVNPAAYQCSFVIKAQSHAAEPLKASRITDLWRQVVARHPSLRTTFLDSEERPSTFDQVVLTEDEPNVTVLQDETYIHSDEIAPLDSTTFPHHLYIYQISSTEVVFRLEISHAVVDGQSAGVLLQDLYAAYANRLPAGTSMPYADFVRLEERGQDGAEEFWAKYLEGAEETYLQGGVGNKSRAGIHTLQEKIHFPADKARQFCDRHGVTMVNVCQVAWGMVLRFFALNEDVTFSYVTSGRQSELSGMHEAVGLFISGLIIRMDFSGNPGVVDMLKAATEDVFQGMAYDKVPLLQEKGSKLPTSQKWGNSILSFGRDWESLSATKHDLTLSVLRRLSPTDYDHSLNIDIGEDSIDVDYDIWTSTTNKADAENILKCFLRGIEFILASPKARAGDFDAISDEDAEQLGELNGNGSQAVNSCIHTLVQEVTDRQPDAVALHAWDGEMTYRELDVAASSLADYLTTLEVGPEVMVGICMDKSLWAAVCMLAVLKAGAVVLPLGTTQPHSRLQTILQDTKAPILLADTAQMERLPGVGPQLIKVDAELLESLAPASRSACTKVGPNNAAWVVYTSGSTGVPKGVVLQHSALCSSIKSHGPAFGVQEHSRVLQFASHTFDVTIQEVFTTICQGGCVCIPSEDDRVNHLQEFIAIAEINFLSMTSTVAGFLDPAKLPLIKNVILMGEPVKPTVLDLWKDQAIVLESYAPSECSIYATVSPQPMKHHKQVSVLGVPLSSCFWIVDPKDYNYLCPIGAPGELLIEGPLLARGYLNNPEKTAQSFIVDPGFVARYNLGSGRRMYRTGDLVRKNDDGSYTTLGRRDTQIKIRGQRLEVDEIEYHITRHPSNTQAVVVFSRRDSGSGQLVAAFSLGSQGQAAYSGTTIEDNQAIDKQAAMLVASEIQLYLSQHVPDYMVPRIWIPMATLSSGKADRRALTNWINDLSPEDIASFSEFRQIKEEDDIPETSIERQLRDVWSNVLNIPTKHISYQCSFLSIGGDSITAMQVVSACRALGLTVSVRDMLQSPVISELALKVKDSTDAAVHFPIEIPDEPFDLSPAQHMFFNEIAPAGLRSDGQNRYNQSICFRLQQPVEQSAVARAFEMIVAKHVMLRARFRRNQDDSRQQYIEKQLVGSYRFQTSQVGDDAAARDVIEISQGSLDIKHGPVFAVDFFELPDRQILFLTAHHLVIDLMSWRILAKDLEQLLRSGTMLAPHSLLFPTWSSALAERARQYASEKATPVLEAPPSTSSWVYWGLQPDQYISADQVFITADLDEQITRLLLGPANQSLQSGVTDILLAALHSSFRQVFDDRSSPAVYVEGHGRDDQTITDWDLSDTVGWLTTVTPLSLPEDHDDSFVSVLKQVKDLRRLNASRKVLDFALRYLPEGTTTAPFFTLSSAFFALSSAFFALSSSFRLKRRYSFEGLRLLGGTTLFVPGIPVALRQSY